MGDSVAGAQPDELFLNGLKPDEPADSIFQVLDNRRWLIAEERAAELIACIKPTEMSEERRLAVADYIRRLIMQCFPCQVFTFGSVPLKTYLPDGDIDLTAFSWTPDLKDLWPNDVRNMLESEEKNENAEFQVQDVQFIQAEVKIVKCLVENIVVDISFNQIGGLCTLCFLEEVDSLINHNHLFKRSIILIKAWCYYESRILGAHHGLISTYALETLVLYIFHVFNDTFKGPLEVLYRFLEFFSKFDWENFCVSLWGPVPLDSLPEIAAELPRKDGRQLLLSNSYLETCYNFYSDNPHQEQQNTDFPKRSFNVVDPLRLNNNLGRSVSRGNFFRIRSAFAFGAIKLARLLDCPEEDLCAEVNQFFVNTWQRHGNRIRPDAPCKLPKCIRPSSPDFSKCKVEEGKESGNVEANDASTDHRANASKSLQCQLRSGISSQIAQTCPTPEFADVHVESASRSGLADGRNSHVTSPRSDKVNRKVNGSEALGNLNASSSSERPPSACSASDYAADSEVSSSSYQNNYIDHRTFGHASKDHVSLPGRVEGTLEEEQELTNMMTNSMFHGFNGQFHLPLNMPLGNLPFAVPPSILASLSRNRKNVEGMYPGNFTMVDNPWATNMQFKTVPPSMTHYFHGTGFSSANSEMSESVNEEINPTKVDAWDVEEKNWLYHDGNSYGGFDMDNRTAGASFDDGRPFILGSHFKEQNESFKNDPFDHRYQSNLETEAEQTVNSRILHSARDSASRSRTSSESSWDGAANKISKVMKERRGRKTAESATESAANERVYAVSESDSSTQPDDVKYRKDWKMSSNINVIDRKDYQTECTSSGQVHQLPGVESPPINGMEGQRNVDKPGVTPLRFIPTGPPVPFLAMLTVYNVPNETGTKPSTRISENEKSGTSELNQKLELADADIRRWDTFDSDYPTHWQNLLYARSCQNSQKSQGIGYPSQFTHSPVYGIPSGGSVRPLAANMNWCMPSTGGDGRFIPAPAPFISLANRPPNVYQPFVEEMPRYRGTGTYLPNPKINVRDRQVSGNRRANYSYDRSGHQSDRGGNWNHSKSRVAGRNNIQNHYDKSGPRMNMMPADESGAERSWVTSHRRQDSQFAYQSQVDSLNSPTSSRGGHGSADVAYDTYSLPDCGTNGVSPSLASVPPLMMLHPYSQKIGYSPHPHVLEFGSLGPVELSGMNGFSVGKTATRPTYIPDETRFHGNLSHKSSPDQPSSPY